MQNAHAHQTEPNFLESELVELARKREAEREAYFEEHPQERVALDEEADTAPLTEQDLFMADLVMQQARTRVELGLAPTLEEGILQTVNVTEKPGTALRRRLMRAVEAARDKPDQKDNQDHIAPAPVMEKPVTHQPVMQAVEA